MKSPKQWVSENSQAGSFDTVNTSSEAEDLVRLIQQDAVLAQRNALLEARFYIELYGKGTPDADRIISTITTALIQ